MKHDGDMKKIESIEELVPGAIIRMVGKDGTIRPFSDMVLLGPVYDSAKHEFDMKHFKVARPYLYASSTETTSPTPLMWAEVFEIPFSYLRDGQYVIVMASTGKPYTMVL